MYYLNILKEYKHLIYDILQLYKIYYMYIKVYFKQFYHGKFAINFIIILFFIRYPDDDDTSDRNRLVKNYNI